jgi:hypothetical protein
VNQNNKSEVIMEQESIDIIKNHLADEVISVTFTKTDGTERVMKCTTNMEFIPKENHPSNTKNINYSDEVCRVYDVENEGWRSFRWDSVLTVNFSLS